VGWQCAGSYIRSGNHHTDGAFLLLSLNVAGFRSKGGVSGGRRLEVGRVSFSFDLDCESKCELLFMQVCYLKVSDSKVILIHCLSFSESW
jgi:hypothetical protein